MLSALTNSLKVKGLREKIFFILAMIAVYRIGAHIPVPGVDPSRLSELFQQGGLLGFFRYVFWGSSA